MWILLTIILLIVALFLICLLRTLMLKPTPAQSVTIKAADSGRSHQYGEALAKMVGCETISAGENVDMAKFYRFHSILEELFPNIHKTCEKHDFDGSLLFKWKGKGQGDPILLMSHFDVVEANGPWKYPPFEEKIIDGVVWGRGTVDTKASLFCLLRSVEELIAEGFTPACDVYMASSCTEEVGGKGAPATVKYLKDQGVHLRFLIDEGGMIIDEPIKGVKGTYAMVGVVEKGTGDLKFTARSQGGHASMPGKNTPLPRLGKFMRDVEKNYPFRSEFNPSVFEMFKRITPNMDFGLKFIFANMWLFKPILKKVMPSINATAGAMLRTTLAFTMAGGSAGLNVLPQEAYVTGNMRFIPHQGKDESIRIISDFAQKYDIETEIISANDYCPVVDYNGDAFKLIEEAASVVYPGVGVAPYTMTGATDARFYTDICENAIRFAPLYINDQQFGSIHALDENIDCASLPHGVDFYKYIIKHS